jgi:hypothetical protein
MGIKDVTTGQPGTVGNIVTGLDDALRRHRFAAIVLDNRDTFLEVPALGRYYHRALTLPDDEKPRLFTGAGNVLSGNPLLPDAIWVPGSPADDAPPPPAAR